MSTARLPLLNRMGWAFLAALAFVVAYLVIDRPITQPETITGIVTHVYVSTPQYRPAPCIAAYRCATISIWTAPAHRLELERGSMCARAFVALPALKRTRSAKSEDMRRTSWERQASTREGQCTLDLR